MNKQELKKKYPGLYSFYRIFADIKDDYKENKRLNYYKKLKPEQYEEVLSDIYEKKYGLKLDWNNLETYTEKMQWAKIYDKDPRKTLLADKYAVREWVKERIGESYLVPLLGTWEKASKIDFDSLPEQFVLKTNKGSGDIIIVEEKSKLSAKEIRAIRKKMNRSMKKEFAYDSGLELHYAGIPPKIIAEKYLGDRIQDYKFLCFDGQVFFCWVDVDRYGNHKRNVYDLEWNLCDWNQYTYGNALQTIEKPQNFEAMIEIADKLCKDFSHVRVDLYNIEGRIYFGEMTFTNGSGYECITPRSADKMLGDLWNLDMSKK